MINLRQLLEEMIQRGASDLHLTVGVPPKIRVDGKLESLKYEPLTREDTQQAAYSALTDEQKKRFEIDNELDFSFGVTGLSRFRGNLYLQKGSVGIAIRRIPYEILTFKQLGLPQVVEELANRARGLVLVTGPTGSGKSTTLAAMIDKINRERSEHIITIEDPIEFQHQHKKCIVNQREVGSDTQSFHNALRHVLRQDPDVVLIGEMRDMETIEAALRIAETGHLTFATLHTNSCAETIGRIIDVFPSGQQAQVRAQLAFVLQGVVTQTLLPKASGRGRVMAMEIMIGTPAIAATIRDAKEHQIYSLIQAGRAYGMQTMNQSLLELVLSKQVKVRDAMVRSGDRKELDDMLRKSELAMQQKRR
ncbi:MAG: type IV pilus twitching motility protein PilT [Gemmatimonadetes bacterium]|nr:MAG: type IV pilus twitching motility protein PilT [Gemmatimonadota bacterium]